MGACTLANRTDGVTSDGKRWVEYDTTLSAAYATGGDTVSMNTLGLKVVDQIHIVGTVGSASGVEVRPVTTDPVAPKVSAYPTGSQAAAASDQSSVACRLRFIGS